MSDVATARKGQRQGEGQARGKRPSFMAVVEDGASEQVVRAVFKQLGLPLSEIHRGGIPFAVQRLQRGRSPRGMIVDISSSELPISDINSLADVCEPGTQVITLGSRSDIGLFRDLIDFGVHDYLVKPITPELLQSSLAKLLGEEAGKAQKAAEKLGRLVGFIGARGGVGASMIASNCAWMVANGLGRRVVMLDGDLQLGTAGLYLGVDPNTGLREALEQPSRIDSVFVERSVRTAGERLHVLSGEEPLDQDLGGGSDGMATLTRELRRRYQYVLVDLPRGSPRIARRVMQDCSTVILVTDLTLAGLRDTARLLHQGMTFEEGGTSILIVANKVGELREGTVRPKEFERQLGRAIDIFIPFDGKRVPDSLLNGEPLVERGGPAAREIIGLAEHLTGGVALPSRLSTWAKWIGIGRSRK